MADKCDNQGTWWVKTPVDGKTNVYCLKNIDNQEYLTSKASEMASGCNGSDQWWVINGTTNTCIQNVASEEYLTNKASSMASKCDSSNQWWTFSGANYSNIN